MIYIWATYWIIVPLFYDLTTFYILGQKFVKFVIGFLENSKKSKRHSEINWPLKNTAKTREFLHKWANLEYGQPKARTNKL